MTKVLQLDKALQTPVLWNHDVNDRFRCFHFNYLTGPLSACLCYTVWASWKLARANSKGFQRRQIDLLRGRGAKEEMGEGNILENTLGN